MSKSILRASMTEVRPSAYLDYRSFLKDLYAQAKAALGSYTYRQMDADLGFGGTTAIHQIASGYRPLSKKAAERIVEALALTGIERSYFTTLVAYEQARSRSDREKHFEALLALKSEALPNRLDGKALKYFSEWYHPIIRELVTTTDFCSDPAWIAAKLEPNVTAEQAAASLELLTELGYLHRDPDSGRYLQTQERVHSGSRVEGLGLLRFHQLMIDHARDSLMTMDGQRRDVSAITVAVDGEQFQKLRSLIHAFQLQLLAEAEKSAKTDQVYQINIQMFPFTKI